MSTFKINTEQHKVACTESVQPPLLLVLPITQPVRMLLSLYTHCTHRICTTGNQNTLALHSTQITLATPSQHKHPCPNYHILARYPGNQGPRVSLKSIDPTGQKCLTYLE